MRKIILSVAVAAMALTTTASALEDIKVNGQAKIWYETNDKGVNDLFTQTPSSGEVVFKLGMTGKQGDVGFGTTIYQSSSMGLETSIASATRTNTTNGGMFTGEAYVTAPMGSATTFKFGKQELNTPFAFTEKWNAIPNTFNAAVISNKSIDNLTLVATYIGQDNATNWKVDGEVSNAYTGLGATTALGGLYKTDSLALNAWYYNLEGLATALWVDAGLKVADINLKAYLAQAASNTAGVDATMGYALSAATKVSDISLFAAASMVGENLTGGMALSNTSTDGKKTKLPTAGVYTDGLYVAMPGSTAIKVKAVTKIGDTKLIAQLINNTSDIVTMETTEIDVIAVTKLGDFNVKGIIMNRSFANKAKEDAEGGMYVRAIVSLNF